MPAGNQGRQFELFVKSVVDYAIFMLDLEGRVITWNKGAEQLFGYREDEALGKGLSTFYVPADVAAGKPDHLLKAAEAQGHIEDEAWCLRKDGSRFWADAVVTATRDAQGRLIGFGKVTRDLTTRRLAEEKLRRAYERLIELDALKDHFLSTVSHEMKTPLSLILGYTELLQDKYPHEEFLDGIHDGSMRLLDHLNKMLDYSALLSGSLPLYKTEVNLCEITGNVRDIMEEDREFRLKKLHLDIEVAPDVPAIQADSRRLAQMLIELLDNAKKFTPDGGELGIRVFPSGEQVRLDVWNTGSFIPERELSRIWEAFTQLETDQAFRQGGLGLGLTIVKELAELHGGRVEVKSRPEEGTCFSIYLPVQTLQDPALEPR
ncbi:MAG TPA: PAS domain-containing sensor histidine kinase [Pantanalinema sp.]